MTEAFRLGFMAKMAELQKESQLLRLSDSEAQQYDSKTGRYRRADPNDTTPWTDRERRGIEKLHKDRGRTTPIVW